MTIYVNNEPQQLTAPCTVLNLLAACRLEPSRGLAIAINNTVIARTAWDGHALQPGDRITLIRASKGG